jgi:hypothetical protein
MVSGWRAIRGRDCSPRAFTDWTPVFICAGRCCRAGGLQEKNVGKNWDTSHPHFHDVCQLSFNDPFFLLRPTLTPLFSGRQILTRLFRAICSYALSPSPAATYFLFLAFVNAMEDEPRPFHLRELFRLAQHHIPFGSLQELVSAAFSSPHTSCLLPYPGSRELLS